MPALSTTHRAPKLSAALFEQLIEAAGKAPSPDNNQPWAFRHHRDQIYVFHRRERAVPSDVGGMFSWLAIGAAIENIVLAASARGLVAQVEHHVPHQSTSSQDGEHVATIEFQEGAPVDPLYAFIDARVTNRRLYSKAPLPQAVPAALSESIRNPSDELHWLTSPAEIKQLAKLVNQADRIRFEHRPFHEEFHDVLRYGQEEAGRTGDGLDLRTLEIPRLAWPVLRWLRPWSRMRLANRVGMSRMFARYSVKQVVHSGAIGLLVTSERSDRGYREAGRSLERIWLAATRHELAFQPLGSLPLFLTKLDVEGPGTFLADHAACLQAMAPTFYELFPEVRGKVLVMLFRVGWAKPPSARSLRLKPEQICIPGKPE